MVRRREMDGESLTALMEGRSDEGVDERGGGRTNRLHNTEKWRKAQEATLRCSCSLFTSVNLHTHSFGDVAVISINKCENFPDEWQPPFLQ